MKLGEFLRRMAPEFGTAGAVMRGRVSKVSVLANGVRSVVIHFGGEEPGARDLRPGVLCQALIEDKATEQPKSSRPKKTPAPELPPTIGYPRE